MASEILSRVASAELECENKLKTQRDKASQASQMAKTKADENYAQKIAEAKESAAARLSQATEYAEVILKEQQTRTEEEIAKLKSSCTAKESPVVLALSKKILELA